MKTMLVITNGTAIYSKVHQLVVQECINNQIDSQTEIDKCYRWVVKEALKRIISESKPSDLTVVEDHYRHDIYLSVLDAVAEELLPLVGMHVVVNNLEILAGFRTEILITEESFIFARYNYEE